MELTPDATVLVPRAVELLPDAVVRVPCAVAATPDAVALLPLAKAFAPEATLLFPRRIPFGKLTFPSVVAVAARVPVALYKPALRSEAALVSIVPSDSRIPEPEPDKVIRPVFGLRTMPLAPAASKRLRELSAPSNILFLDAIASLSCQRKEVAGRVAAIPTV